MKKSLVALLLAGLSFLPACKKDDHDPWNSCPSCSGILYTRGDSVGLDVYKIGVGDSHFPVENCGFQYYQGNKGGFGSTLEEIGCANDSVHLIWAYGGLSSIRVSRGWEGQTDTGLKIGDPIEKYLDLYPEAKLREHCFSEDWIAPHFVVDFDENDNITAMKVVDIDFARELRVGKVLRTCPCSSILYTTEENNDLGFIPVDEEAKTLGLGDFKMDMPERDYLIKNCNFEVDKDDCSFMNLRGCDNDSVYLKWSFNKLEQISIRNGWEGQTDTGLKIGDPIEKFLNIYPNAMNKRYVHSSDGSELNLWATGYLRVSTDKNNLIDIINLRDFEFSDPGITPIGPWQSECLFSSEEDCYEEK